MPEQVRVTQEQAKKLEMMRCSYRFVTKPGEPFDSTCEIVDSFGNNVVTKASAQNEQESLNKALGQLDVSMRPKSPGELAVENSQTKATVAAQAARIAELEAQLADQPGDDAIETAEPADPDELFDPDDDD